MSLRIHSNKKWSVRFLEKWMHLLTSSKVWCNNCFKDVQFTRDLAWTKLILKIVHLLRYATTTIRWLSLLNKRSLIRKNSAPTIWTSYNRLSCNNPSKSLVQLISNKWGYHSSNLWSIHSNKSYSPSQTCLQLRKCPTCLSKIQPCPHLEVSSKILQNNKLLPPQTSSNHTPPCRQANHG